jgi:hypothetical protein
MGKEELWFAVNGRARFRRLLRAGAHKHEGRTSRTCGLRGFAQRWHSAQRFVNLHNGSPPNAQVE